MCQERHRGRLADAVLVSSMSTDMYTRTDDVTSKSKDNFFMFNEHGPIFRRRRPQRSSTCYILVPHNDLISLHPLDPRLSLAAGVHPSPFDSRALQARLEPRQGVFISVMGTGHAPLNYHLCRPSGARIALPRGASAGTVWRPDPVTPGGSRACVNTRMLDCRLHDSLHKNIPPPVNCELLQNNTLTTIPIQL